MLAVPSTATVHSSCFTDCEFSNVNVKAIASIHSSSLITGYLDSCCFSPFFSLIQVGLAMMQSSFRLIFEQCFQIVNLVLVYCCYAFQTFSFSSLAVSRISEMTLYQIKMFTVHDAVYSCKRI